MSNHINFILAANTRTTHQPVGRNEFLWQQRLTCYGATNFAVYGCKNDML